MIDWIKENKKYVIGAAVIALILWGVCGCKTEVVEETFPTDTEVEVLDIKLKDSEEKLQELLEVTPEVVPEEVVE